MKRAILGGFTSLVGSVLLMAFSISATSMFNSGWSTPPGKFLTAIAEADVSVGFWLSVALIVLGGVVMVCEFLKKD